MTRLAPLFEFSNSVVLVRYGLSMIAGMLLVCGLVGFGSIAVFSALFLVFSCVLSYAVLSLTVPKLDLRRVVANDRAFEQGRAVMQVRATNSSSLVCIFTQLLDRFSPAGYLRQVFPISAPLLPGREYEIPLSLTCMAARGKYKIGPVRLVVIDPFGMFCRSATDDSVQPFFVYPSPVPVTGLALEAVASQFSFGVCQNRRIGTSLEFAGIHEYNESDDSRRIHWAASGKHNRLMVREFHQSGAAQFTVFFDLCKVSRCGIGPHSTTEYAIKIVGSLAKRALDEGHQVQLLGHGDRPLRVAFGSGVGHLAEIMQQLTEIRAVGKTPLYEVIQHMIGAVPPGSQAVVVFSKCDLDVEHYLALFSLFRGRSVDLTAVIIDHTTFLPVYQWHQENITRAAHQALIHAGARVFYVRQGDDLAGALSMPLTAGETAE